MTQLTTVDTNNFAAMAKAMGIAHEKTSSSSSSLARLRINHAPIMGTAEVNGKSVNWYETGFVEENVVKYINYVYNTLEEAILA